MTFRVQYILPMFTNVPEDVAVNNFHFTYTGGPGPVLSELQELADCVGDLYSRIYAAAAPSTLMSPVFNVSGRRVKIYNLEDPSPRAPIFDGTPDTAPARASSGFLPTEAAVVLSFQGNRQSGVPQARRRGRVYLPTPGDTSVDAATQTSFTRLKSTFLQRIADSANLMRAETPENWTWVVWSEVAGSATPVTNGWVNNELDTQRRRGVLANARTVWAEP